MIGAGEVCSLIWLCSEGSGWAWGRDSAIPSWSHKLFAGNIRNLLGLFIERFSVEVSALWSLRLTHLRSLQGTWCQVVLLYLQCPSSLIPGAWESWKLGP